MKNLYTCLFLLLTITLSAQEADRFTDIIDDRPRDPRMDQMNFVPNEVLVKFKDEVIVSEGTTLKSAGIGAVDRLLKANGVSSMEKLFPQEKRLKSARIVKDPTGRDMKIPSLHNIYKITVPQIKFTGSAPADIYKFMEEMKALPEVEYVEPNYYYSVNGFTIDSDVIHNIPDLKSKQSTTENGVPNDPLYSQQTNMSATHIDQVWQSYTTGDGSQVIGILDTGIDYEHPDLKANIWINQSELNGVEGYDDDGNGFIDDIRGWDFINNDNAPLDDNMHGTHVAGIAGAVGGNGTGVAGAAWNVKLMPVKVFQSNGVGDISTIVKGIEYATHNGATIQNMSFGSCNESMTLRNTLENAYAYSILVAAAGNGGFSIGSDPLKILPFYPAAYHYVIGVQDAAEYSNYDQDGPVFSRYANLLNYEVTAPGTSILSSVPNGGYRILTGTSMATPLVAGGIALYNQQNPTDSKELLFGNLINTAVDYVDFKKAIEVTPKPQLKFLSAMVKDSINGQNGNGYLEPGETLEIFPLIKNYWGPTNDVHVGIEFAEFEDQTKATILESEIAIGSITAYATLQDLTKSLKIKIASNVSNNVNITFKLSTWSGSTKDYLSSTEFVINVKNTILLYGIIGENMTLHANKEYLVSDNLIFNKNATITIKPGTVIKIADGKKIGLYDYSRMVAQGKKDSIIEFTSEANSWSGFDTRSMNNNPSIFDFVKINNSNYTFANSGYIIASNLLITNCKSNNSLISFMNNSNSNISKSNLYDNLVFPNIATMAEIGDNLNIINSILSPFINPYNAALIFQGYGNGAKELNIFNNGISISVLAQQGTTTPLNAYLGTSDPSKYRREIIDALNSDNNTGLMNMDSISKIPFAANHGIVWKVLVDGKDAQDEFDLMDPIGVGFHQFDVYFNREMDQSHPPQISYGVREPYNQKIIPETGTWSADGKIYSVTHEVKIGAADGINRIRVQGARDLDYFDIPVEDGRFNMLVQSAGSASAGFMATPGLGKIALEWEAPVSDLLEDVLGYNLYRYQAITDTTFSAQLKLNTSLINDPAYVDYQVEEGKRYYYQYKILRTSFDETDFSKAVAASPLTSKLGDSNGDFEVNVMDLVNSVGYILGNNPTPFIFKAADVNADTFINILDVIGTVDIILHPTITGIATATQEIQYISNGPVGEVIFYWEDNDLYIKSETAIGGLQLAFEKDFVYTLAESLPPFEWLNYTQDNQKVLMMYSFNGLSIAAGRTKLLSRKSFTKSDLDITKAVVGTPEGYKLTPIFKESGELVNINAPIQSDQAELISVAPNPSRGIFNLQYYIPEQMDKVLIQVYSLKGELLWSEDRFKNTSGNASASLNLSFLIDGIYLMVMDVLRSGEIKKREVKKLVISKN